MTEDELTQAVFSKINSRANGTGGLHSLDEDLIKGLYKSLYADGKTLNLELLASLAQEKNWSKLASKFLIEKAEQAANGGRVQLTNDKNRGDRAYQDIINPQS